MRYLVLQLTEREMYPYIVVLAPFNLQKKDGDQLNFNFFFLAEHGLLKYLRYSNLNINQH